MEVFNGYLLSDFLGTPVWLWKAFLAIVVTVLVLDLGILHKENREIGVKESLVLSAGYVCLAVIFGAWVWWFFGAQSGMEWYTGYMVEWSLSLDNIFAISMIFTYFAVPRKYQYRVLFWGILGVILMRGIMIGVGAALVVQFSWILYLFGVFLVVTGIKMLWLADQEENIGENPVLLFFKSRMRVTPQLHDQKFFVRLPDQTTGRTILWATPLFLCLVLVETIDLIFAVDSVPAIFAITQDPFIVYTSNIFAILGLRALYFALAAMIHRFQYLKYALAMVLIFIGSKIFLVGIIGKIPPFISLTVTFTLLAGGIVYSLYRTRRDAESGSEARQPG
jgi:tellurite resistance protein TerC